VCCRESYTLSPRPPRLATPLPYSSPPHPLATTAAFRPSNSRFVDDLTTPPEKLEDGRDLLYQIKITDSGQSVSLMLNKCMCLTYLLIQRYFNSKFNHLREPRLYSYSLLFSSSFFLSFFLFLLLLLLLLLFLLLFPFFIASCWLLPQQTLLTNNIIFRAYHGFLRGKRG
jgi:hypothetical protein